MTRQCVDIGSFRLDLQRRALVRDGQPVKIGSRALELLCALAESPDELVTKDELLERVWPHGVVEENALHVHISALRKLLAEDPSCNSPIMTVAGRGYRLLAQPAVADVAPPAGGPKPRSIAVLPFSNLSNDPAQDYLADGMVDEIITGLGRIRWLQVIGRNSSFAFKGKAVDPKSAGQALGVRYLLGGSVKRSGNRVRIASELVDAVTGVQIWADRFEREFHDVFALQDEVTFSIIGELEPKLRSAEVERVKRKRPESLDAYDCLLRAMPFVHSHVSGDALQAIPILQCPLQHAPGYGAAHASLALCFHSRFSRGGLREEDRVAAVHHARHTLPDAADDSTSLAMAAFVLALDAHDMHTANDLFERALAINPSSVFALRFSALALAWQGRTELTKERARLALQLSPLDPLNFLAWNALAIARHTLGDYQAARDAAANATRLNPGLSVSHAFLAAALLGLGDRAGAEAEATLVTACDPTFSVQRFAVTVGMEPAVYGPLAKSWIALGLPEL
ncbi:MAG: winged helix-turn-helix domain-containing protein [Ramlibacter sp.]